MVELLRQYQAQVSAHPAALSSSNSTHAQPAFKQAPSSLLPSLRLPFRQLASSDSALLAHSEKPSYEERLASGPLYHVQLCCLLLALLYTAGVVWLTHHIDSVFYQQDEDVRDTCTPVLSQWLQHIDTDTAAGEAMHSTLTALLHMLNPVKEENSREGTAGGEGRMMEEQPSGETVEPARVGSEAG